MRKSLKIEEMDAARDALNLAIQQAMMLMNQKNVMEASVGLSITIELCPGIDGLVPRIGYKTNNNVPIKVTGQGKINADQIYWDEDLHEYMLEVKGEQVRLV
jgi:hypothetical protein